MPGKRRRLTRIEDDNKFETEGLSFLNEDVKLKKNECKTDSEAESESDGAEYSDNSGISDNEEQLLNENTHSDDDAPEDIGFHDSRISVLSQLRSAIRQVDTEKQKKKEKRKKLDAQFKEQKEKKLKELATKKLPEDFFTDMDDKIPMKKICKAENKKKEQNKVVSAHLEPDEPEDDVTMAAGNLGEDYIALTDSISGVKVTTLKSLDIKSKSMAETAADFRQQRLYGSFVRRQSNKSRLATAKKRRQRFT